jgi:hypothetical protein
VSRPLHARSSHRRSAESSQRWWTPVPPGPRPPVGAALLSLLLVAAWAVAEVFRWRPVHPASPAGVLLGTGALVLSLAVTLLDQATP